MLSILLPCYDINIISLVEELHKQAILCRIDFEILAYEDGSKSDINSVNKSVNALTNVVFKELPYNIGRSQIRNKLAEDSEYEFLLFIDSDSLIINDNYLKNYIDLINNDTDIIYGGRIHPKQVSKAQKLRWKYGIEREDLSVNQRNKDKYKCLLFNNTIVRKSLFLSERFDNTITQYGHEDTILAYQMSLKQASVLHIDNSILHGDIDGNLKFLVKTDKSIQNLNTIFNLKIIDSNFISLLRFFIKIRKISLHLLLGRSFALMKSLYKKQLLSNSPQLWVFDLYRLSYFCYLNLKK